MPDVAAVASWWLARAVRWRERETKGSTNEFERFTDGCDAVGIVFGDVDIERFFQGEDEFDHAETVDVEIFLESCCQYHLFGIACQHINYRVDKHLERFSSVHRSITLASAGATERSAARA